MYCPNCGSDNDKKQNYCRRCGLQLAEISRLYISQMAFGAESDQSKRLRGLRKLVDIGQIAAVVSGILLIAGLWLLAGQPFSRVWLSIVVVAFFFFQALRELVGYLQRRAMRKTRRFESQTPDGKEKLRVANTNKLHQGDPTPAASITEAETDLLYAERRPKAEI